MGTFGRWKVHAVRLASDSRVRGGKCRFRLFCCVSCLWVSVWALNWDWNKIVPLSFLSHQCDKPARGSGLHWGEEIHSGNTTWQYDTVSYRLDCPTSRLSELCSDNLPHRHFSIQLDTHIHADVCIWKNIQAQKGHLSSVPAFCITEKHLEYFVYLSLFCVLEPFQTLTTNPTYISTHTLGVWAAIEWYNER